MAVSTIRKPIGTDDGIRIIRCDGVSFSSGVGTVSNSLFVTGGRVMAMEIRSSQNSRGVTGCAIKSNGQLTIALSTSYTGTANFFVLVDNRGL